MQVDSKQICGAALSIGMLVMLLNLIGNGPLSPATELLNSPEETALMVSAGHHIFGEHTGKPAKMVVQDETPEELWGQPGPVLHPCWSRFIKAREGKTWGYVLVVLSNGPQYHRMQVCDAVIVARILGATLLLPTLKDAAKEPNGDFDKIYDVNNFISSLKDVVRVVGRLPEGVRSMTPTIVKVPYKVTPDYIEENIQPIFKQKLIIQVTSFFPASNLKVKEVPNEEVQAIQCLVTYSALRFHSQVQKLGERLLSRLREAGESSGGRFIALDLRPDVLRQKTCSQSDSSKNKKCFDAYEVGVFLQRLGFSSNTAIYLTQSRWNQSLDPLKQFFPNIYTKEYSMPFNEEKQILYSGNTQFERAIDFYVCTRSDVFVPAVLGVSYVSISGERIAIGKLQIFVPMDNKGSSKLEVSKVTSPFVTKKDHAVYSCFCNAASSL